MIISITFLLSLLFIIPYEPEAGSLISTAEVDPSPESLYVSWVMDPKDCKRVQSYNVSWTDEEGKGDHKEVDTTSYTIEDLLPCKDYDVTIQPLMEESQPISQDFSKHTRTSTKSPAVEVQSVQSESLEISWNRTDCWVGIEDFKVTIVPVSTKRNANDCTSSDVTCYDDHCAFDSKGICEDFPSCNELNVTVLGNTASSSKSITTAPPTPEEVLFDTEPHLVTCSWTLPPGDASCTERIDVTMNTPAGTYSESLDDGSQRYWDSSVTACDLGSIQCSVKLFGGTEGESGTAEGTTQFKDESSLISSGNIQANPESLEISWELETSCDRVTGYQVKWKDGYQENTTEVDSPSCTIEGLVPCADYQVSIQPLIAESIKLGLSFSRNSITSPTAPQKPENLTCADPATGRDFQIDWTPPLRNKCVKGYFLKYTGDVLWSSDTDQNSTSVESISYHLEGLTPYTEYTVCVSGVIADGSRGIEDCCTSTTKQEAPGAPEAFHGTVTSDTNVTLSWEAPSEKNGIILGYVLTQDDGNQTQYTANETRAVVNYLDPDSNKNFTLQAYTEVGVGKATSCRPKPTVPGSVNILGITLGILIPLVLIGVAAACFMKRDKVKDVAGKMPQVNLNFKRGLKRTTKDRSSISLTIQSENHDTENSWPHISHPQPTSALKEVSRHRPNEQFNRHRNNFIIILPYDQVRIMSSDINRIQWSEDVSGCDTMNVTPNVKFIASQGLGKNAAEDFWKMVWESDCQYMVMLTNPKERGKEKRFTYWPDPDEGSMSAGRFNIYNQFEEESALYTTRCLEIEGVVTRRSVTLYHFTAWPDFGVPSHVHQLLDFLSIVRRNVPNSDIPVVVHCSEDVGRVVTFIGAWSLIDEIMKSPENPKVDVKTTVMSMKENLPLMVQSQDQYLYLCKCILAYMDGQHKWDMTPEEGIYENIDDLQFAEPQYDIAFQHSQDDALTNPGFERN